MQISTILSGLPLDYMICCGYCKQASIYLGGVTSVLLDVESRQENVILELVSNFVAFIAGVKFLSAKTHFFSQPKHIIQNQVQYLVVMLIRFQSLVLALLSSLH